MKSEEKGEVFLKSLIVLALGGYSFFSHRQNFSFKISLSLLKPIDYVNSY